MEKVGYYWRLFQIFWSYKRNKTMLNYMPIRLWVEPTSICNLRCVMCPSKSLEKKDKGFMDMGLFRNIIDEAAAWVYDVHLLHRGESLLHPEFFAMAKYAAGKHVRTKLHTNGTLLDEEKSRQMLESDIDQLSFSFDGYDKETYESIRINGDFDLTVKNIQRFLELKKEMNRKKPYTILELIDFPDSRIRSDTAKQKALRDRFEGLPLDRFIIKEFHNWAGEVEAQYERKTFSPCTFLWNALVIFWDGAVLPCSQDFFGYYTLGNVKDMSLAEIWNSDKMLHLRKQHLKADIEEFDTCRDCDRVWREKFLGIPKEYLWKFLLRKMP